MNHCIFVGNIVKKPEARTVAGKKGEISVIKFSIGVNDRQRDKVTFPNLEAWGDQADLIVKHLDKGDLIRVYTRLETESWSDAKTGETRYRDKFVVERFEFVESRRPQDERGRRGGDEEAPDAGDREEQREEAEAPPPRGKKGGRGKGHAEEPEAAVVGSSSLISF